MRALIITSLLFVGLTAHAEELSPEKKVARAQTELTLTKEAKDLEKPCGFIPKVKVEWKNFPADTKNFSVSGYCESGLDAVQTHCGHGAAKKAYIKKNVKTLVCDYSKTKEGVKLKKKGKEVRYFINFDAGNLSDKMRKEALRNF